MLPIYHTRRDADKIAALQSKLSLKPLLLEGLDDETGEAGKFEVVRKILREVQKRGDAALLEYTAKFDRVALTPQSMQIQQTEIDKALREADPKFLRQFRNVSNVTSSAF